MVKFRKAIPLELIIWVTAFILLYNLNLNDEDRSICPIHGLGFKWCPGCGLGKSIHLLMHGNFSSSFEKHWFGIPVFIVLSYRIIQLSIEFIQHKFYNK